MQYDVNTPEHYVAALEDDWRKEKLLLLQQKILEMAPETELSINYKMLCFKINDIVMCHLNAQKNTVSLYVGNISKVDPTGQLLEGYNLGKGCIRLSKTKSITNENFTSFLTKMVTMGRSGIDLSC
ncbi:DUF1801 domain-containing protein [Psychrosphaera algicola]|uniref:DUF1801 domain-containing protein n=1 Tax=Psychrosphaera algicola TaxID=3023714 RepID=A0ABT5FE54_9GAMM|nr:DUF1801 domain-containing protein [Psychrosphaera sp. G1-22]MDC2889830.1 DUF1801 domain-containing protein [Psychrosphaera sp. G1-22]